MLCISGIFSTGISASLKDHIQIYKYLCITSCGPGVRFIKVFRTDLGHKYILVECSVIALCLPVMSKITRYKLVCYK